MEANQEQIENEAIHMIQQMRKRLRASIIAIADLIHEIKESQGNRLKDIRSWDTKQLIAMNVTLKFWIIDGIVRLLGVDPECKDIEVIFNEAKQFQINIETLAKLLIQTEDPDSITALCVIAVDGQAISKEFQKRCSALPPVVKALLDWREDRNDEKFDAFCENVIPMSKAWYQKKRIKVPQYLINVSRRKEKQGTPYDPKSQIDKKILNERASIFEAVDGFYSKLREQVKRGDLRPIPFSLLSAFRPSNSGTWTNESYEFFQKLLKDTLEKWLPAFDGTLGNIHLEYIAHKRKGHRKTTKVTKHEVVTEAIEEAPSEDTGFELIEVLDLIWSVIKNARHDSQKLLQAFKLILQSQANETEAAEQVGISRDLLGTWKTKIKQKYFQEKWAELL